MDTKPLGPFLGINNRREPFALRTKEGDFVADAENVDLTNGGYFVRRPATELVQGMTGAHSLHMTTATTGFFVRGGVLYSFTLSPAYAETLVKVLTTDDAMSYVSAFGALYFSNGTDSGRWQSGAAYPLGLPTPSSPVLSAMSGTLAAGWYQVAVSYGNGTTGEEGGVSASSNIEVPANGGITVTLPGAASGATSVNVYVSTVNGSVPMRHSTVSAATVSLTVSAPGTGRELNSRFESPLPAGRLFLFNGMLCSYKDGDVHRGIPYRPGYCLTTEARIPFPEDVTNVIPAQNGIYVTADKTYWLAGQDLADVQMIQDVLPYGAVAGTAFSLPDKALVGWFGHKGFVLADTNGQAASVTADNVDVVLPMSGFATVLEEGGYRRVLSCGYCMNLENKGVTRYDAGYDFNSLSVGFGMRSDGLRRLTGGTGKVAAFVALGKNDFGTETLKRVPAAYVGASSDRPMQVQIVTPQHDYTYTARTYSDEIKIHRIDPGKGLRSNWFDITVHNTDGATFTLASVSFAPIDSARRI